MKRLDEKETEENEEMMSNVTPDMKKRILSEYYRNMYEDEDADQEYFESIRNVNHGVDEEEKGDEDNDVKETAIPIVEDSSLGKKNQGKGKNSSQDKNGAKSKNKESKSGSKDVKSTPKDTKPASKDTKASTKDNKSKQKDAKSTSKDTTSSAQDTKSTTPDTKNSKPPKSKSDNPYRKNIERNKLNHHRRERFDKKHGLIWIVCCVI